MDLKLLCLLCFLLVINVSASRSKRRLRILNRFGLKDGSENRLNIFDRLRKYRPKWWDMSKDNNTEIHYVPAIEVESAKPNLPDEVPNVPVEDSGQQLPLLNRLPIGVKTDENLEVVDVAEEPDFKVDNPVYIQPAQDWKPATYPPLQVENAKPFKLRSAYSIGIMDKKGRPGHRLPSKDIVVVDEPVKEPDSPEVEVSIQDKKGRPEVEIVEQPDETEVEDYSEDMDTEEKDEPGEDDEIEYLPIWKPGQPRVEIEKVQDKEDEPEVEIVEQPDQPEVEEDSEDRDQKDKDQPDEVDDIVALPIWKPGQPRVEIENVQDNKDDPEVEIVEKHFWSPDLPTVLENPNRDGKGEPDGNQNVDRPIWKPGQPRVEVEDKKDKSEVEIVERPVWKPDPPKVVDTVGENHQDKKDGPQVNIVRRPIWKFGKLRSKLLELQDKKQKPEVEIVERPVWKPDPPEVEVVLEDPSKEEVEVIERPIWKTGQPRVEIAQKPGVVSGKLQDKRGRALVALVDRSILQPDTPQSVEVAEQPEIVDEPGVKVESNQDEKDKPVVEIVETPVWKPDPPVVEEPEIEVENNVDKADQPVLEIVETPVWKPNPAAVEEPEIEVENNEEKADQPVLEVVETPVWKPDPPVVEVIPDQVVIPVEDSIQNLGEPPEVLEIDEEPIRSKPEVVQPIQENKSEPWTNVIEIIDHQPIWKPNLNIITKVKNILNPSQGGSWNPNNQLRKPASNYQFMNPYPVRNPSEDMLQPLHSRFAQAQVVGDPIPPAVEDKTESPVPLAPEPVPLPPPAPVPSAPELVPPPPPAPVPADPVPPPPSPPGPIVPRVPPHQPDTSIPIEEIEGILNEGLKPGENPNPDHQIPIVFVPPEQPYSPGGSQPNLPPHGQRPVPKKDGHNPVDSEHKSNSAITILERHIGQDWLGIVVVLVILVLLIMIICVICCLCYKRHKAHNNNGDNKSLERIYVSSNSANGGNTSRSRSYSKSNKEVYKLLPTPSGSTTEESTDEDDEVYEKESPRRRRIREQLDRESKRSRVAGSRRSRNQRRPHSSSQHSGLILRYMKVRGQKIPYYTIPKNIEPD